MYNYLLQNKFPAVTMVGNFFFLLIKKFHIIRCNSSSIFLCSYTSIKWGWTEYQDHCLIKVTHTLLLHNHGCMCFLGNIIFTVFVSLMASLIPFWSQRAFTLFCSVIDLIICFLPSTWVCLLCLASHPWAW